MTRDNFNLIRPLLNFESSDDFYFIQIMQRRKDNPDMKTGVKIIKEFYIDNLEQFDNKQDQIIEMAHKYNARATIRLNKRSYKKNSPQDTYRYCQ